MEDEALVEAVLEDWRTAPVSRELNVMLGFLEKLTLEPGEVTSVDVEPLRAAGLSDEKIEDALHVCAIFSVFDRLADSFGFDVPGHDAFVQSAEMLLRRGYV